MANVILYASCHAFSNEYSELDGGIETVVSINNTVYFYSSSHSWYGRSNNTMKGGSLIRPAGIASNAIGASALAAGICKGMADTIDGLLSGLEQARDMLNSPMNDLRGALGDLVGEVGSPLNDIDDGIDEFGAATSDAIPDMPDLSELERILQACGLLQGKLLSGDPFAVLDDFLKHVLGFVDDLINGVFDLLDDVLNIVEAIAAGILNAIAGLLNMLDISGILKALDGLLNCIAAICGQNFNIPSGANMPTQWVPETPIPIPGIPYPEPWPKETYEEEYTPVPNPDYLDFVDNISNYANNLLNDINLDELGNFKPEKAFEDFELAPEITENIEKIAKAAEDVTTSSKDAIMEVADNMKPMLNNLAEDAEKSLSSFDGTKQEFLEVAQTNPEILKSQPSIPKMQSYFT